MDPGVYTILFALALSLLLGGGSTPVAAVEGDSSSSSSSSKQQCTSSSLRARLTRVNSACCGRAGSKCKGGRPSTCSPGCARTLLKMHSECKAQLDRNNMQAALAPVLAMCKKATILSPPPPVPQNVSGRWPAAYTLAAATLKEDGDHSNAVGEYKRTKAM
jgi:hypothetical protein